MNLIINVIKILKENENTFQDWNFWNIQAPCQIIVH